MDILSYVAGTVTAGFICWALGVTRGQRFIGDRAVALEQARGEMRMWRERAESERQARRRADLAASETEARYTAERDHLARLVDTVVGRVTRGEPIIRPDGADEIGAGTPSVAEADRIAARAAREARARAEADVPPVRTIPPDFEPVRVEESDMPPVARVGMAVEDGGT